MIRFSNEYVAIFQDTFQRTSMPSETIVIDEYYNIEPQPGQPNIKLIDLDTVTAATQGDIILNFASGWTPGGGVTKGATAQEENICRRTSLYHSLTCDDAKPFYTKNHGAPNFGADTMILTKGVEIVKDANYKLLSQPEQTDVLTVAAPRLTDGMPCDEHTLKLCQEKRIYAIVSTLAQYGYRRPILGAWGCGAYKNDPTTIATLFKQALEEYAGYFDEVIFAIPKGRNTTNYDVFKKILLE